MGEVLSIRGELKTVPELARLFDLNANSIRQMVQEGLPIAVKGKGGRDGHKISTADFYQWNVDRARRNRIGRPPSSEPGEPGAKQREQAAKAELAELKIAEARGNLISQEGLEQVLEDIATDIRIQFLAFVREQFGDDGAALAEEFLNELADRIEGAANVERD